MKRHLKEIAKLISKLDKTGHKLIEEQKVRAIIFSLPIGSRGIIL